MTNIAHEEIKAARRAHRCDWCNETIDEGQPYVRQRNKDGADVWTYRAHPECMHASGSLSSMELECEATVTHRRGCTCDRFENPCPICGRTTP